MRRPFARALVAAGLAAALLPLGGPSASAGDVPEIVTTSLPDAHIGFYYAHELEATGGVVQDYYWNICVGWTPPDGLNIMPDGTLQGWPQPQMFGATVNICAQVSVQSGQIWSTKILPLEIDVDNGAPPNPTITTTSLPAATPGQPYQAQLQATGGDGSGYTWLLCPGWALPAGLALSAMGLISGTPGPSAEPVVEVCFRVISGGSTGLVLGLGFTVGPGPDPVPGGSTVTLRKYKVEPTSLTIASGDSVEWVNRSGGRRTILSGNGKRVIAVLKPGTSASTRLVARRVHRFQVLQTGTVISVTVV